jgi:hypothetical protein
MQSQVCQGWPLNVRRISASFNKSPWVHDCDHFGESGHPIVSTLTQIREERSAFCRAASGVESGRNIALTRVLVSNTRNLVNAVHAPGGVEEFAELILGFGGRHFDHGSASSAGSAMIAILAI